MNYQESIDYIARLAKEKGMVRDFTGISSLMDAFSRPDKALKIIHIGGTNGKGSTSTYIANILGQAGFRVGLYASPHIFSYRERFAVDGQIISEDALAEIVTDIDIICQADGIRLTGYELEVALAILYFKSQACDFAILEVGMGGRLDASNFIEENELGVFVKISYDHQDFLGQSLEDIAREKAGIIKEDSVNLSYFQEDEVSQVLDKEVLEKDAQISYLDQDQLDLGEVNLAGQSFSYKGYEDLHLSMLGAGQPFNASLAIMAIEKLREKGHEISDEAIYQGLGEAKLPGRFQLASENPLVIVDGAHNPDGVSQLMASLDQVLANQKHYFIFSSMRDKDYQTMIDLSLAYAKHYFTVMPQAARAMSSFDLKRIIQAKGGQATACGSVDLALARVLQEAGPQDSIVCFGSLYQIGEILKYFK